MKVSKEKMVLHLPFDEEVGSSRAYNYAPNRTTENDAILGDGCSLTEDAVFGNSLQMSGNNAECSVFANLIDYSGEFTISTYVKPQSSQISFLMNFGGGATQHSLTLNIVPLRWYFVAIQRVLVGSTYHTRFFLDNTIVFDEAESAEPVGCSLQSATDEAVCIDELKVWNRGLSMTEVFALQRENDDVEYYVDGENFKYFGVEVSASNGLVDALERKDPLRVDWDSRHGEVIDLSRPHWQRREISLECFIVASSNTAFVRSLQRFMAAFEKAGTQRLTCEYAGSVKPLEYDVYRNDRVEVEKTWNEELMVGTFTLALIEPQPIKMVLKHICQSDNSQAWFEINTTKPVAVTWGDQDSACTIITGTGNAAKSTNLHDANGSPLKVQHTYAEAGEYDIVIHGNIEDVENLSTNCIIIWSKL